eukprot:scaffold1618_cov397-Prasinococcus_capsulatus_cf.AAC.5
MTRTATEPSTSMSWTQARTPKLWNRDDLSYSLWHEREAQPWRSDCKGTPSYQLSNLRSVKGSEFVTNHYRALEHGEDMLPCEPLMREMERIFACNVRPAGGTCIAARVRVTACYNPAICCGFL